jgi:hypothetical protein
MHCPAHVYLLCVSFPAKETIMEITCVLPSSEMPISAAAKIVHCQYWVLAYSKSTKHHNKAPPSSKKNTSARSQSSWHLQPTKRAEATVAGHSDNTSNAAPSSVPILSSFYIIKVGTGTPITTPQPKPLTRPGSTSTMVDRRGRRTLVS